MQDENVEFVILCDKCNNEFLSVDELMMHHEKCLNKCRFCQTQFSRYFNMINHQKTNKTCLDLQATFECASCLICHKSVCEIELECLKKKSKILKDEIVKKTLHIKKLEESNRRLNEKANMLSTNIKYMISKLSSTLFVEFDKEFTIDLFYKGVDGIIDYIKLMLTNKLYYNVDEDIFQYKDDSDSIVNDKNLSSLWCKICQHIKPLYQNIFDLIEKENRYIEDDQLSRARSEQILIHNKNRQPIPKDMYAKYLKMFDDGVLNQSNDDSLYIINQLKKIYG
jgi:hypothetical protein